VQNVRPHAPKTSPQIPDCAARTRNSAAREPEGFVAMTQDHNVAHETVSPPLSGFMQQN